MSNSKKRNVSAGGKSTGSSAGTGKSNTTGPKVSRKRPNAKNREKALADARKAAKRNNSQMTTWIVAAVVVLALVIVGVIAVVNNNNDRDAAAAARDLGAGTVSLEEGTITWGKADAPAKVEYWIDLLCPACRQFETSAASTIEKAVSNGDAQLVVYPTSILNTVSKPAGYSARAAAALFCAADQPEGYKFMKQLYDQQPPEGGPGLSDDELAKIASEVGLSKDWNTCYESGKFKDVPEQNNKAFDANGFKGTPTVRVNGTELTQRTPEELQQAISAVKK